MKSHHFLRRAILSATMALLAVGVAAAGDVPVPFKGSANEVLTSAMPTGFGAVLSFAGHGQATHLGRYTTTETVLYNPLDGTLVGTRVIVAANGDQLYADVAGAFTSPTTAVGTDTFTGGTGRFADASGQAQFAVVSPDGIHVAASFDGSIQY